MKRNVMKSMRCLFLAGISLASLCAPLNVQAQTATTAAATPVVTVPHDDQDLSQDLKGAPPEIQGLIVGFDKTRDKYLAAQDLLLIKIKNATTPEEREKLREQLQDNRQAFMTALQGFREQLRDELSALKGKVSHEEFLRIIDAAHDAATEGGLNHHKGH